MTATLVVVFVLGLVATGMIFGPIDAAAGELTDETPPAARFAPPRRWVRTLVADGLEHTVVVAPRWHPFTDPVPTSDAQMFGGIRIAAALVLRTVLWKRWRSRLRAHAGMRSPSGLLGCGDDGGLRQVSQRS